MTLKDWQTKSVEDAKKELKNLTDELFHLRLKKSTGQLEKNQRVKEVKRTIARGLTYLQQKSPTG